jgi:broad specificity phosphatase PhoE
MKWSVIVFLFFSIFSSATVLAADTMIIVVRHAEKSTDDAKDPSLSAQGNARANKLAEVLKNAGVKAVYTTQYKRAQQTGLPTATQVSLQIVVRPVNKENAETYTSDLLKEILKKHHGETVLIVGHSNTVPEIVKHLTYIDVNPILEDEFDRLYVITLGKKPRLVSTSYKL